MAKDRCRNLFTTICKNSGDDISCRGGRQQLMTKSGRAERFIISEVATSARLVEERLGRVEQDSVKQALRGHDQRDRRSAVPKLGNISCFNYWQIHVIKCTRPPHGRCALPVRSLPQLTSDLAPSSHPPVYVLCKTV
ncbi:hypothetical protein J6590_057935 [Homalodisca vitripennis]|nr:hypothetical protein J6590_057935 [Homalodisca vitripennis]